MRHPAAIYAELLRSVFKKPATILYPAVKADMPEKMRGQILFHPERCVGCKLCMKDCPAAAIEIIKIGDEKIFDAKFDLGQCIYCGQCVDSCNKDALEVTGEFELAQLDPAKLAVTFHAKPDGNIKN